MVPFNIEVIGRIPNSITVRCLHVRHDGSIIIIGTNANQRSSASQKTTIYLFPAGHQNPSVGPITLKVVDYNITSIVELTPGCDVFAAIAEGNVSANRPAAVQLLSIRDLQLATPAFAISLFVLTEFPPEAQCVSGSCLLTPNTMLVADRTVGCMWRVDSDYGGYGPRVKKWISHESLRSSHTTEGELAVADIGLVYNEHDGYVYFTSPSSKLLARVKVDRCSLEPQADVEVVATGLRGASALFVDPRGGFAYVTSYGAKALERIRIPESEVVEFGAFEHCLSLNGAVYPGVLAADWCSANEVGKAAYIVTRAEYLSLNLDPPPDDDSSLSSTSTKDVFDESKLVTRVIKVKLRK